MQNVPAMLQLDPMFAGIYNGKVKHENDLEVVLRRAQAAGVEEMIVTAGSLTEAEAAAQLCCSHPGLRFTVGVHPTRCMEFLPESERGSVSEYCGEDVHATWEPSAQQLQHAQEYMAKLRQVAEAGKAAGTLAAIGECGLDYDRLQFCPAPVQRFFFKWHFELAQALDLPMFLHNRNTSGDFVKMVEEHRAMFSGGVAHSFTGDADELQALLAVGLYIGVNGCSLKTQENCDVIAAVPLDRLMLETDCPWCDIRPSHASHRHVLSSWPTKKKEKWDPQCTVKGRNEPCFMAAVAEAVAGVMGKELRDVEEAAWRNALLVFGTGSARAAATP